MIHGLAPNIHHSPHMTAIGTYCNTCPPPPPNANGSFPPRNPSRRPLVGIKYRGESLVWTLPYLSSGVRRKAGRWAWLVLGGGGQSTKRKPMNDEMKVFLGCIPWLHRALSCVVRLLLLRLHLFLVRLFLTAEDYRLTRATRVIFDSLSELTEEPWSFLLHLSTRPVPMFLGV